MNYLVIVREVAQVDGEKPSFEYLTKKAGTSNQYDWSKSFRQVYQFSLSEAQKVKTIAEKVRGLFPESVVHVRKQSIRFDEWPARPKKAGFGLDLNTDEDSDEDDTTYAVEGVNSEAVANAAVKEEATETE
jgi:hypothetical protein